MEQKIQCVQCGKLHTFCAHLCGDQSVCPDCRSKDKDKSEPITNNSAKIVDEIIVLAKNIEQLGPPNTNAESLVDFMVYIREQFEKDIEVISKIMSILPDDRETEILFVAYMYGTYCGFNRSIEIAKDKLRKKK
jgi:hypothetical protein